MTQLSLKQAQKVEKILESINDQNAKNLPQKLLDFLPRIAQVIDRRGRGAGGTFAGGKDSV